MPLGISDRNSVKLFVGRGFGQRPAIVRDISAVRNVCNKVLFTVEKLSRRKISLKQLMQLQL